MRDIGRFIAELRRRQVFKVAAAYAVVGWVTVQAAATLVPHLLLPEGLVRGIIVLVLLGFTLAVVLAWAYDITPDGVRPTRREPHGAPDPLVDPAPETARAPARRSGPLPAEERSPARTGLAGRFALAGSGALLMVSGVAAGWLLNGREDEEHPWPTRGLPLWNLLTERKELVLVEGAGHVPPLEARVPAMITFLDSIVGPVRR